MTLLKLSDRPQFFPQIEEDAALQSLIYQVNSICEGIWGAQRSLSLFEYQETLPVNESYRTARLSYLPIVQPPDLIVEGRYGPQRRHRDRRQRQQQYRHRISEWFTLDAEGFVLDDTGQLNLLSQEYDFDRHNHTDHFNEVRLTYTSGFDIDDNENPTVQHLKSVAAMILEGIYNESFNPVTGQVLMSEEISRVAKESYSAPATAASGLNFPGISQGLMAEFQRYRPRTRAVY